MEVLRFIQECKHTQPELHKWMSSGVDIIRRALHLYKTSELCFSFNGGKDCTVVLHLLRAAILLHSANSTQPAQVDNDGVSAPAAWCGIRVVYFDAHEDFPEVKTFIAECEQAYGFKIEHVPSFRPGLRSLVDHGVRAVLMGTRRNDPDGVYQAGPYAPSSLDWPPCMRICPVLDWPYSVVWSFLLSARLPYCSLYALGYTSLGAPDTCRPNPALAVKGSGEAQGQGQQFLPAWCLEDEKLERLGRHRPTAKDKDGAAAVPAPQPAAVHDDGQAGPPTAALVVVGDEILSGRVGDTNVALLAAELTGLGVRVSSVSTVGDHVEDICRAVGQARQAGHRYVLVTGGLGPTHDDVTLEGIARAYGCEVRPSPSILSLLEALHGQAKLASCPALLRMAAMPDCPQARLMYTDGTSVRPATTGTDALLSRASEPGHEQRLIARGWPLLFLGDDGQGQVLVLPGVPAIVRRKWATFAPLLFPDRYGKDSGLYCQHSLLVAGCGEAELAALLATVAHEAKARGQAAHVDITLGSYPANEDTYAQIRARACTGDSSTSVSSTSAGVGAAATAAPALPSPPGSPSGIGMGRPGPGVVLTVSGMARRAQVDSRPLVAAVAEELQDRIAAEVPGVRVTLT